MKQETNHRDLLRRTGQGASMPRAERSNVWKLWNAAKKAVPAQQVTFYDEGIRCGAKAEWSRWANDLASRATGPDPGEY